MRTSSWFTNLAGDLNVSVAGDGRLGWPNAGGPRSQLLSSQKTDDENNDCRPNGQRRQYVQGIGNVWKQTDDGRADEAAQVAGHVDEPDRGRCRGGAEQLARHR